MLLRKYKKDNRYTVQELANDFGVSHRTMHYWLKTEADITGRKGQRKITLNKVLAEEGK